MSGPTESICANRVLIQSYRTLWIMNRVKSLAPFNYILFASLKNLMFHFIPLFKMSLLDLMRVKH